MKIGQNNGPNLYKTYEVQQRQKGQKAGVRGADSQPAENVLDLSEEVKELQFFRKQLANMPPVREGLVSALKTSIEEQSFGADENKIIEGMERELFLDKECNHG